MGRSKHAVEVRDRSSVGDRSVRASDRDRSVRASDRDRSVRASDRDREVLVAQLGEHTSAGRLTLPEFEERVSAAYAAQTLGDLDQLARDLPATPSLAAARPSRSYAHQWWMVLFVGVICVGIWALTSLGSGRPLYFWPMWVVGPWGVSMLFRAGFRVRRY